MNAYFIQAGDGEYKIMNREDQAAISAAIDIYEGLPKCHQCEHFKEDEVSARWHDCTKYNCRVNGYGVACFDFKEKGGKK